jgi:hypothetical protein
MSRDPFAAELRAWFLGRLPEGWFVEPPEIAYDRDGDSRRRSSR